MVGAKEPTIQAFVKSLGGYTETGVAEEKNHFALSTIKSRVSLGSTQFINYTNLLMNSLDPNAS